jgi:hypothetical protein
MSEGNMRRRAVSGASASPYQTHIGVVDGASARADACGWLDPKPFALAPLTNGRRAGKSFTGRSFDRFTAAGRKAGGVGWRFRATAGAKA